MKVKIICLIAVFVLCFSISVSAESELLVYGEDDVELFCNAFDMDAGEISEYISQNNITYFAINRDNTKQIKRTELTDEFSKKIVDFSVLSDSEIASLSSEISGFENSKGSVVTLGGYKLLKSELKTKDSGGEYVLTQFVTVKNAKKITLSFYTSGDTDRGYIDAVLEEQFPKEKDFKPLVIGGTVAFSLAVVVVLALIILELRKKES